MQTYYCYAEGLNNGFPGAKFWGYYGLAGQRRIRIDLRPDEARTINEAHYMILIRLLESLRDVRVPFEIRMDSNLIVNQVKGKWAINQPNLLDLQIVAKDLMKEHGNVFLNWSKHYELVTLEGKD